MYACRRVIKKSIILHSLVLILFKKLCRKPLIWIYTDLKELPYKFAGLKTEKKRNTKCGTAKKICKSEISARIRFEVN